MSKKGYVCLFLKKRKLSTDLRIKQGSPLVLFLLVYGNNSVMLYINCLHIFTIVHCVLEKKNFSFLCHLVVHFLLTFIFKFKDLDVEVCIHIFKIYVFFCPFCQTCQVSLEGQPFVAKGGKAFCKKHSR